jgi:DNA polymerase I
MTNPLFLPVDAYSLIYRAFYAIRELTGPAGQPVNAIYGLAKMLRKLLADRRPTHSAAVFDLGAPQRRLTLLASYKAQRPPTPPALEQQLPVIRELLPALGLPIVEVAGEEADDLIASLSIHAARDDADVMIVSNDKDFAQIVGPRIRLLRPDGKASVVMDAAAVEARYGVRPEQMVDYLSLVGDTVDNIPGVPGIGPKTAAELLRRHGTVEALLAQAGSLDRPKLRAALVAHADRLRANRALIALHTDLPVPVRWQDLRRQRANTDELLALCQRLGFRSLAAELQEEASDLFAGQ